MEKNEKNTSSATALKKRMGRIRRSLVLYRMLQPGKSDELLGLQPTGGPLSSDSNWSSNEKMRVLRDKRNTAIRASKALVRAPAAFVRNVQENFEK